MNEFIPIEEIISLVKIQKPEREDLIFALTNTLDSKWKNKAYYSFVDSRNANLKGAKWQFDENIILEHKQLGTIVIDFLKDKRMGGIEFLDYLD